MSFIDIFNTCVIPKNNHNSLSIVVCHQVLRITLIFTNVEASNHLFLITLGGQDDINMVKWLVIFLETISL